MIQLTEKPKRALRSSRPLRSSRSLRSRDGHTEQRILDDARLLCSGPGRLCQALGVTREHDDLALDRPPFELLARDGSAEVISGPRIGITRAAELPWRYAEAGSRFLSRPLRPT